MTPQSIINAGFTPFSQPRGKIRLKNGQILKPLMVGSDGGWDSGKTEFALSLPGIVQMLCIDRGDGPLEDNPNPPAARNRNVYRKSVNIPSDLGPGLQASQYVPYFTQCCQEYHGMLQNPDSTAVVVDGGSDLWELHILADFGKTTGIYPQTRYKQPYAEHRALINSAFDSGKIVLFTNKVKDGYEDVLDSQGNVMKDELGNTKRRKTGEVVRQGFTDQDYLFNIQIRHLFQPAGVQQIGKKVVEIPKQWGLRVMKFKSNRDMEGAELWGADCNFKGLVTLLYPDVPLARWGF